MRGKNPTRKQKIIISLNKLNFENWLVTKDTLAELHIKNRASKKIRVLKKGIGENGRK